jgi:hypothetical protein
VWALIGWWLGRRFEDHEKLQGDKPHVTPQR